MHIRIEYEGYPIFNIFMTTGLDENDRFFYLDPEAKQGDYVDLHAEMDCLVAISASPATGSTGFAYKRFGHIAGLSCQPSPALMLANREM
jgi:uncharacterized protein YcgI (DUF1989 family)